MKRLCFLKKLHSFGALICLLFFCRLYSFPFPTEERSSCHQSSRDCDLSLEHIASLSHGDETFAIAWNPAFSDYVVVGSICKTPHNRLYKKIVQGDYIFMRLVFTFHETDNTFALAWDPTGEFLFVGNADVDACIGCKHSLVNRVYRFDAQKETLTLVANTKDEDETYAVAWDHTGNYIAVGNARGCRNKNPHNRIYQFDRVTLNLKLVATTQESDNTYAVAWNPDPQFDGYLVFGNAGGFLHNSAPLRVYTFNRSSQKLKLFYSTPRTNHNTFALSWGPCGRYLAVGEARMSPHDDDADQIYFFDPVATEVLYLETTFNAGVDTTALTWSENGFQIIATNAAGLFNCNKSLRLFSVQGDLCENPCVQQELSIQLTCLISLKHNPTCLSLHDGYLALGLALFCGGTCECPEDACPPCNSIYRFTESYCPHHGYHENPYGSYGYEEYEYYEPYEYYESYPYEYGYENYEYDHYEYEPYHPYSPPYSCPFVGCTILSPQCKGFNKLSVSYNTMISGNFNPRFACRPPKTIPGCPIPCPPNMTVQLGLFPALDCDNGKTFCEDKENELKRSSLHIEPGVLCFEICSANIKNCKPLPRIWKSQRGVAPDLVSCLCNLRCQIGDDAFKSAYKLILKDLNVHDRHMLTQGCKINALESCDDISSENSHETEYADCHTTICHKAEEHKVNSEKPCMMMKKQCGKLSGCCNFDPQCDLLTFMYDNMQDCTSGAIVKLDFTSTACCIYDGKRDTERSPIFFSAKFVIFPGMTVEEFFSINTTLDCFCCLGHL